MLFCILHLLLEAAYRSFPSIFDLKSHCHRLKLDYVYYSFIYKVFSIFEIILRAHKFVITSFFLNKSGIINFNIFQFLEMQIV